MAGPSDTVDHLTEAINRGDLEAALALYEPNAVLVVQPGQLACGATQLREALARFIALEPRSEEHTSELQSQSNLVCRLLLEKKKISLIGVQQCPRRR